MMTSRFSPFWRLVLLAFAAFSVSKITAQTFAGQGNLVIPPGAPVLTVGITESIATVTGVGVLGGCVQIDNVTINSTHTFVGDVCVFLKGPGGQVLDLTTNNGGGGDNWQVMVLKDAATNFPPPPGGNPPYNGTFRPEGRAPNLLPVPAPNTNPLGTFTFANRYNGTNADGDWTLHFNDHVAIDVGLLISWSITFTNGTPPVVNAGPDVSTCAGQPTTLTATSTPPGATFQWSTGQNGASISVSPTVTTTYTVTATAAGGGCTSTDQVEVTISPAPTVDAGPYQTICAGQSATLTASGPAGATYAWSNGGSGPTITVTPSATTFYTVTATENGCSASDAVQVTIAPAPTVQLSAQPTICEGNCGTINFQMTGAAPFSVGLEIQSGGALVESLPSANFVGGNGQVQYCPPPGSPTPLQFVVCTFSDQNCSL